MKGMKGISNGYRLLSLSSPSSLFHILLPTIPVAGRSNVCRMVTRVPRIHRQHPAECPPPRLRVNELAAEVSFRHRFQQRRPTRMHAFDDLERNIYGHAAVGKLGPAVFIVRTNGRRTILGQRQLESAERIDMTVGDVMHRLSQCPPALTVWRVELRIVQIRNGRIDIPR